MKTLTYNSANLSSKERLTITSLLGLFVTRLNAKWVSVNDGQGQAPDVVLVDADKAEGRQALEAPKLRETLVAVTEDDRWPRPPFIARPIRAYGPSGVIVLFNSIVQALETAASREESEARPEPARIRMTGRLEAVPAPVRTSTRPQATVAASMPMTRPFSTFAPSPNPPRGVPPQPTVRPQTPPPQTAPQTPGEATVPARVSVRWGPPEPVVLPPLTHMPGARIHQFGKTAARRILDLPEGPPLSATSTPAMSAPAPAPVTETVSAQVWRSPEPENPSALVSMPVSHHPVELYRPPVPVIGRARIAAQAAPPQPVFEIDPETPVLRAAPSPWRELEPEPLAVPEVVDVPSATLPAAPETVELEIVARELETAALAETISESQSVENPDQESADALFSEFEEGLQTLSEAVGVEVAAEAPMEEDSGADWWGTAQMESDLTDASLTQDAEGSLLSAIKAIKASNQPSILEIAGLPAVCVIPARNIYFTTAPAARLETAMGARSAVTWRSCASEAEARQKSGTEQSRQVSLEQLCWSASLLNAAEDSEGLADRVVRLRRWPPLTESRTRSKFVRYATLLSGAHATPREIAEITGDALEDIVTFVQACGEMNLLETSEHAKAPVAAAPMRTQGVGVLRGMIEQLAPPKV